jgi:transposase
MKDKNNYKQYTREFKLEAVKISQQPNRTVADVARELELRENDLHAWRKTVNEQGNQAFPGRGRKPNDEVIKLKREVERLQEENNILKKAAIFFAKETGENMSL